MYLKGTKVFFFLSYLFLRVYLLSQLVINHYIFLARSFMNSKPIICCLNAWLVCSYQLDYETLLKLVVSVPWGSVMSETCHECSLIIIVTYRDSSLMSLQIGMTFSVWDKKKSIGYKITELHWPWQNKSF